MSSNNPERPYKYLSEAEIMRFMKGFEEENRERTKAYRRAQSVGATDDMESISFNMEHTSRQLSRYHDELITRQEERRQEDERRSAQRRRTPKEGKRGVIKRWNSERGFGFIAIEGEPDVFIHFSELRMNGLEVVFDIEQGPKGLQARNVRSAGD